MDIKILTWSFHTMVIFLLKPSNLVDAVGYSYSRFIGPVSGPEHAIIVRDRYDGRGRLDYVAKPEYHFAYGVEDAKTRVLQNRRETRNGDDVKGIYSVVDPDGSLRVVKYTADNVNGFQAEVITNGISTIHGQDNLLTPTPISTSPSSNGNHLSGKDESNLYRPRQQIQVQHPESNINDDVKDDSEPTAEVEEEDTTNSTSAERDASEYEERDDDSAENDESEEVEDY